MRCGWVCHNIGAMDALTHLLKTIHFSARTHLCSGSGSDWKMQFLYRQEGIFHIVLQGHCYLRASGQSDLIRLQAGDCVALPTGGEHWISDTPEGQHLPAENVLDVAEDEEVCLLKHGDVTVFQSGAALWRSDEEQQHSDLSCSVATKDGTILLCGTLAYDASLDHPFLKSLPCFIQVSPENSVDRLSLTAMTQVLSLEATANYPGKALMVDSVAAVFFVRFLRQYMNDLKRPSGYLAALADPNIGVALNLIHSEKNKRLTISALASAAAMSRTKFTRKFAELVGVTPKIYLTNTRLLTAREKLMSSNESILSIAQSAGYTSEAAFGKAFKKHFHRTPGDCRRRASEPKPVPYAV